jgi:hypothetical protein
MTYLRLFLELKKQVLRDCTFLRFSQMSATATYRDSTSYVSQGNDSLGFTTLGNYQTAGMSNVPQSSLLLLTIAPANQKYFSASPSYQQRLDNFRLPPSTQVAVNLTTDYNDYPGGADSWTPPPPPQPAPAPPAVPVPAPLSTSTRHSSYAQMGTQAYKMGRGRR